MKIIKKAAALLAAGMLVFSFAGCSGDSGGGKSVASQKISETDGTTTLKIQENANGFVSTTGSVKKDDVNWIGYTGAGYIENLIKGTSVIYTVTAAQALTDAKIAIHYANWQNTNVRGAYIYVNGTLVNENNPLSMTYTNKGQAQTVVSDRWTDTGVLEGVSLNAGSNTIEIKGVPAATYTTFIPTVKDTANGRTELVVNNDEQLSNIDYLIVNGLGIDYGTDNTKYYILSYASDNETAGYISSETSTGSTAANTSVTLTAVPNDGYVFECWSDGSTDNPYTFNFTKATYIFAHFKPAGFTAPTESDGYMGYATVTSDSASPYTITGGYGGTEIVISSLDDMETYKADLSSDTPHIIKVTGIVTTANNVSKYYSIGSNKTLYSTDGNGRFKNIEVRVSGANVIIRNLKFGEVIGDDFWGGTGNDALALNGARHVWVDHCEFQSHLSPQNNADDSSISFSSSVTNEEDETEWKKDFYDGLLDIKNGGSWITISNCYFHDHYKACLCGSGDDGPDTNTTTGLTDKDMRVTFNGNYWYHINARQPLFRYGTGHILNSYFDGYDGASCINVRAGSKLYIEGNKFTNIKTDSTVTGTYVIGFYYTNNKEYGNIDGKWTAKNNSSDNYNGTVSAPSYTYTKPSSYPSSAPTDKGATLTGLSY